MCVRICRSGSRRGVNEVQYGQVGRVGDEMFAGQIRRQAFGLRDIAGLAAGEDVSQGIAKGVRQIPPRRARPRNPQYRVHEQPAVPSRRPAAGLLAGNQILDPAPLPIRQFPAKHDPFPHVALVSLEPHQP